MSAVSPFALAPSVPREKVSSVNRTADLVIRVLAVLGLLYAAVIVGAEVRESVLESRCESSGRVALWQASSPTDDRRDGFLRFHCLDAAEIAR